MSQKIKHLEFIQNVVSRLASDSFRIKGWTVILISAFFVLLIRENRVGLIGIGFLPVLFFWGLDGYFLWQERLYRKLYDHVRTLRDEDIDFSMDASTFGATWLRAVFSRTLVSFYGAFIVLMALILLLN